MTYYQETTDAPQNVTTTYSMDVGDFFLGYIDSNGSTHNDDWIAVTLTAGQTYTFAMTAVGALSLSVDDPLLYLVDASGSASNSGTWLASDDDGGPGNFATITFTASTTGTYYIAPSVYSVTDTGGYYMLSMTTGSNANYDINMVAGALYRPDLSWSATPETGATITYAIMGTGSAYDAEGNPVAFEQLTAAQVAAVQAALAMYSEVADVTFQQVNPGGTSENATILFGAYTSTTDGAGAYAYYPGSTDPSSDAGNVWLNNDSVSGTSLPSGSYSQFAIIHELGHAMGLAHPGDYNAAPGVSITYANSAQFIQDTQQYTVMSYFDESNTTGSYYSYPDMLMIADIAALQQLYGANYSTRSGDTTYGFNTTEAGSVYDFTANTNPALAIWDGAGTDTIDVSGWSMSQMIDLNDGSFSNVGGLTGNLSIALGAAIENAIGGSGNDTIVGNEANNALTGNGGSDTLTGDAGEDFLDGGAGSDEIHGGEDDDTIIYDASDDWAGGRVTGDGGYDTLVFEPGTFVEFNIAQYGFERYALITYDTGSEVWDKIDDYYNTSGQHIERLTNFDDGTTEYIVYDYDNTESWSEWIRTYDSDGLLTGETFVVDVGGNNTTHDFNGDGTDDILWRNSVTGQVGQYVMNGDQYAWDVISVVPDQNWVVEGTGDFNGDGTDDILWRNSVTGQVGQYVMNGDQYAWDVISVVPDQNWVVEGTGDFNGDGTDDILWRNNVTGQVGQYVMNGDQYAWDVISVVPDQNWVVEGTGDFNGDGTDDILWRNSVTGQVGQYVMNGDQYAWDVISVVPDQNWVVEGTGDFNGDGTDDILWRNSVTGQVGQYVMNGDQYAWDVISVVPDQNWVVEGTGDFNGDGTDDILWRNSVTGQVGQYVMNGDQYAWDVISVVPDHDWVVV